MLSLWVPNENLFYLCPNEAHRAHPLSDSARRPSPSGCQLPTINSRSARAAVDFLIPQTMTALICQSWVVTFKFSQQEECYLALGTRERKGKPGEWAKEREKDERAFDDSSFTSLQRFPPRNNKTKQNKTARVAIIKIIAIKIKSKFKILKLDCTEKH